MKSIVFVDNRAALYNKVDILEFLVKRVSIKTLESGQLIHVRCYKQALCVSQRSGNCSVLVYY